MVLILPNTCNGHRTVRGKAKQDKNKVDNGIEEEELIAFILPADTNCIVTAKF